MDQENHSSTDIYRDYVSSDLNKQNEAIRQLRERCSQTIAADFVESPGFDDAFDEIARDIIELIQGHKLSPHDFVETFTIVMKAKSHEIF